MVAKKRGRAQLYERGRTQDYEENPELTEADFARARPLKDADPKLYRAWKKAQEEGRTIFVKRGRPPLEAPKVHIGFRLSADVVKGVQATGRGYNSRVEQVLREALAKGRLKKAG